MKILSFGEIMLRLTPPDFMLLEQTDQLRMSFVGTGVNLLGSLSRFGQETALLSQVPDNALGRTAVAHLRKLGISDRYVGYSGNHLGSFFVELGYGLRPTQVTYQNRIGSSFCEAAPAVYDFSQVVAEMDWVHICGIALSLTENTRKSALVLAQTVTKHPEKMLCFDFNYRPSLNVANELLEMRGYYQQMLTYADMVFGSLRDLTDLLGYDVATSLPKEEQLLQAAASLMETYHIKYYVGTLRAGKGLRGFLITDGKIYLSKPTDLVILDRIGGGDAYAAGILYGLIEGWDYLETVQFAVANAALAHSTMGDTPMATVSQVKLFMEAPETDLIR